MIPTNVSIIKTVNLQKNVNIDVQNISFPNLKA